VRLEVGDTEIVLQYENGLLKKTLMPGRYTFWKGVIDYTFVKADTSKIEITEQIDRATLMSKQVLPYVRSYSLDNSEKGLLFIDGKYNRLLGSGVYYWWKNDITIHIGKVDTRQLQLEINGQEILTRDKAALRINAWAQYRVTDPEMALLKDNEYDKQLYVAFQLALRESVGGLGFDELLDRKDSIGPSVLNTVQAAAGKLGVSTRSLLNTAKLMEDNPMLYKLKEMEYVEKIAERINHISVGSGGVLLEQMKQLFVPGK
jgi:hypothetical protein